ncbi:4186f9f0-1f4c-4695-9a2f-1f07244bec5c [Thermothielavioides terrestris]|uniref:4186f9f0-1f4c-4695-9a2f-1f07244bec5c n=1 Tax=Thermothielavioides terrestris TaxID=2587410 RepID=A0A446BCI5_9PEZI|nr:4186f9f0-1f4c-4695-9a2f-1f07244bec5c [Thermothielavioides terrestris]
MDSRLSLSSLPSELLISILSYLPTETLVPLIMVSHRFYAATIRILKDRLNRATSRPDQRLMLECYHPTEKLYTPYLYCNYLYTDSFDAVEAAAEGAAPRLRSAREGPPPPTPVVAVVVVVVVVAACGASTRISGRGSSSNSNSNSSSSGGGSGGGRPAIDIYLDPDELFSQLCAITNLVRLGPKPGLFRSHVNVVDGLARVWRGWLAAEAATATATANATTGAAAAAAGGAGAGGSGHHDSVLWTDAARDVGLRFRVAEKDIRAEHPVLVASDEELPVAYRLEFEELLLRSTTLLAMVEKSEVQVVAAEGKAIVLASF